MKIAIINAPHISIPPKMYGGTERVINYQIKGLVEKGHEITLLATGDSEVKGVNLIPITDKQIFFGKTKAEHELVMRESERIMEEGKKILKTLLPDIDIIHSHGVDLIEIQDFPNITTLHNMITLEEMDFFMARKNLYYVSVSQNQQLSFPDLKYAGQVYNGLDPSEFPVVTEPADYLSFLGRFDRHKNPHMAIQLALHLGMKLKMAGKRDHLAEGYWEEEIEPYLDHPLIEFLGEIGMEEKIDLLGNAVCNLHPTGFREPFGLTVLEAAYMGTPTLAIRRGALAELIEPERTGMLVEDYTEAPHVIDKCFDMDRKYIASRSRMLFNHQNMAKGYEQAYEKVLEDFRKKKNHLPEQTVMDKYTRSVGGDTWYQE